MLTVLRYPRERPFTSGCRVATGRSAILHLAKRWKPEYVFMPSLVPEGVIHPFCMAGNKIIFYGLNEDLSIDAGHLAEAMTQNKGDRPLIVVIHYCGMPQPMDDIASIAAQSGALIFSDCAHALLDSEQHNRHADVVLYSLNKFLPVVDGAIIATMRGDLDVSIDQFPLWALPNEVIDWYKSHLLLNGAITLCDENADALISASKNSYENYYKYIDSNMELCAQSAASRAVEATTNFTQMRMARLHKSCELSDLIYSRALVQPEQRCQFAFPIRCNGKREEMNAALREAGILAATLKDKWDHIPLNSGFEIEAEFIDDHLLLPIHEDVRQEDLVLMADIVNSFV